MTENQTKNIYWGIGLENETYLQFEDSLIVNGACIQEKIGCDRYSIDYRKCYKQGSLEPILNSAFQKNESYYFPGIRVFASFVPKRSNLVRRRSPPFAAIRRHSFLRIF